MTSTPAILAAIRFFLILGIALIATEAAAADRITSAESALDRLRAACDAEIKKTLSAEQMRRVNALRSGPSLVVRRSRPQDFAEFRDSAHLAEAAKFDLFGSRRAVVDSTNDTWVLTYDSMKGLAVYLDAVSGKVLCVAFIPEG
jgi:hypothetical protein